MTPPIIIPPAGEQELDAYQASAPFAVADQLLQEAQDQAAECERLLNELEGS